MALQVWLPLNGNLNNQGLSNITVTNNGATVDNSGKIGKCYYFDANSYISENSYNWTNFNINTFSLCCWYKEPSPVASGNSQIICIGTNSGWNNIRIGLLRRTSNGYVMFSISDGSSAVNYNCTTTTFELNTWNHIVCTYDNGVLKIYLNGVLNKTYTTTIVPVLNSSQHLGIGAASNGAEKLTGYLNDVRIYDHALSPKEVEELSKGLVLHYKLDDPYIESTTNLVTSQDCLSSQCYNGAISKYGYGTNTDMYKITGIFENKFCTKVYMGTSGNSAYPYVYVSNLYVSDGTNSPEYKTITFDYFCTIGTCIIPYKLGNGTSTCSWTNDATLSSGIGTNIATIPVITGIWNHITIILHGTTSADAQWGFIRLGNSSHTSDTSNYWLFANMQIELKDHATGYAGIGGNRNSLKVYDSSGYQNHGTIIGNLNISNDTSRYNYSTYFDGNISGILIENLNISNIINTCLTYSFWVKPDGENGARSVYFGSYNSASFSIEKTTGNKLRLYWNSSPDLISTLTIVDGQWQHIVITKNLSTEIKVYLNGILVQTLTNTYNNVEFPTTYRIGRDTRTGTTSYKGLMSDFRIYSTVLSDQEILNLYNTSAYIDDHYNLLSFEDDEEITDEQHILKTGIVEINNFIEINDKLKVLEDGSVFIQIMHHNAPTSNLFTINNCWLNNTENLYSALILLKNSEWINNLSEYEFLACEKLESSSTENQIRWKQTSNPATTTTATGFSLISGTSSYVSPGLVADTEHGCFDMSGNSWWCCCGCYTAYKSGIPGFNGVVKSGYLDLYIRIPNEILKGEIEEFLKFYKKSILSNQILEI